MPRPKGSKNKASFTPEQRETYRQAAIKRGSRFPSWKGRKHSEETKEKWRLNRKGPVGYKQTPEHLAARKAANLKKYGVTHFQKLPEYRELMSEKRIKYIEENGPTGGWHTNLKGFFKIKNLKKYKGDPENIIYRSGYELKYMMNLDHDPKVLAWSSEETIVPYESPLDRKWHRYFVDFWIRTEEGECLIEIKPAKDLKQPKPGKRFLKEAATFAVNQAKWDAARTYCAKRGWEFKILTEKELGIPTWTSKKNNP